MRRSNLLRILSAMIWTTAFHAGSPKADGFKQLTGPQIRAAFVGKVFTDDTHFSFRYLAGGAVQGMCMGKKVNDKWRLAKDELCVTDHLGETCYAVWRKGPAVRLVVVESSLSLDGDLK